MILHSIRISCATDDDPTTPLFFLWSAGDPIFSIECAIAKLQEYVDQKNQPIAVATDQPKTITPDAY